MSLFFVGHGRGGERDAHDNTTLAGYSAQELAAVTEQIHQELRTQFPHAFPENIDKLVLIGCALVNDEKTDGFLFKMAPELLKRGMHPGEIVGYATEIGISRAVSEQGRGRRRYPSMTPERGDYSTNNIANFRVSWSLRFHRRCLRSGHPDGNITEFYLVIETDNGIRSDPQQ
ncbi:C80 family cysteine peptidase [Candidatus Regiella insecticola]|uniref:C80 family cysteine peptidase n=1 Tax=Candidatus Regiella insecticola TaxID=138073 RepID=UPI001597151E|nr:C80 family cysteine peptidase [Candidatus Regiella insecticola]